MRSPATGGAPPEIIPYDHAARFELTGRPGTVLQDVINIGADGPFVAVAVGYGLRRERTSPLPIFKGASGAVVPGDITLGALPVQALVQGFCLNPRSQNIVFAGDGEQQQYSTEAVSQDLANKCLELIQPRTDLSFFLSVIDSSSGRELQDQPVHSLASLGNSRGERPFRPLAQPISFLPRSTLRVQIIEQTPDVRGSLFVVFYGYRLLVDSACREGAAEALTAAARASVGVADARVIPFDYVAKVLLTGRPGNLLDDEVTVNADSAFVATAVGYGLVAEDERVRILPEDARAAQVPAAGNNPQQVDMSKVPLRAIAPGALRDGVRVRPEYVRFVFNFGRRLQKVPADLADVVLERLNRPEDVSFLYGFADTGVGRDWQNRRIHNVAGLGIANGRRPFKALPRPRVFPPRSTLRVSVEEHSGSGVLYFAFHGYKVLGGGGGPS